MGYNGYIINPTTTAGTNTTYTSNVPAGNNSQYNKVNSKGYNGKLVFNFATQYQNWLSLGLNLNSHFTNFTQSSFFQEQNSNATGDQVNNVLFNNELYTYGSGFSFQVGAIAKVYKGLRLGFTFDSPTWYRLNDELTQGLITNLANGTYINASPNTTVIFEPYKLQTPMKLGGSIAYVFGKRGLINIDVSTKNYSSMIFKPTYQFEQTNDDIASLLKSAIDLRVGGEYKIKKCSFRGGYRLEQTPYVDKKTVGDLKGYSGGLGYNFGATKLDFSYSHSKRDSQQQLFSTGLTDSAQVRSIFNSFTLTLLFEL